MGGGGQKKGVDYQGTWKVLALGGRGSFRLRIVNGTLIQKICLLFCLCRCMYRCVDTWMPWESGVDWIAAWTDKDSWIDCSKACRQEFRTLCMNFFYLCTGPEEP